MMCLASMACRWRVPLHHWADVQEAEWTVPVPHPLQNPRHLLPSLVLHHCPRHRLWDPTPLPHGPRQRCPQSRCRVPRCRLHHRGALHRSTAPRRLYPDWPGRSRVAEQDQLHRATEEVSRGLPGGEAKCAQDIKHRLCVIDSVRWALRVQHVKVGEGPAVWQGHVSDHRHAASLREHQSGSEGCGGQHGRALHIPVEFSNQSAVHETVCTRWVQPYMRLFVPGESSRTWDCLYQVSPAVHETVCTRWVQPYMRLFVPGKSGRTWDCLYQVSPAIHETVCTRWVQPYMRPFVPGESSRTWDCLYQVSPAVHETVCTRWVQPYMRLFVPGESSRTWDCLYQVSPALHETVCTRWVQPYMRLFIPGKSGRTWDCLY